MLGAGIPSPGTYLADAAELLDGSRSRIRILLLDVLGEECLKDIETLRGDCTLLHVWLVGDVIGCGRFAHVRSSSDKRRTLGSRKRERGTLTKRECGSRAKFRFVLYQPEQRRGDRASEFRIQFQPAGVAVELFREDAAECGGSEAQRGSRGLHEAGVKLQVGAVGACDTATLHCRAGNFVSGQSYTHIPWSKRDTTQLRRATVASLESRARAVIARRTLSLTCGPDSERQHFS